MSIIILTEKVSTTSCYRRNADQRATHQGRQEAERGQPSELFVPRKEGWSMHVKNYRVRKPTKWMNYYHVEECHQTVEFDMIFARMKEGGGTGHKLVVHVVV